MSQRSIFHNLTWKFSAFYKFSEKPVFNFKPSSFFILFKLLLTTSSFFLKKIWQFICFPKLWQDTEWYIIKLLKDGRSSMDNSKSLSHQRGVAATSVQFIRRLFLLYLTI